MIVCWGFTEGRGQLARIGNDQSLDAAHFPWGLHTLRSGSAPADAPPNRWVSAENQFRGSMGASSIVSTSSGPIRYGIPWIPGRMDVAPAATCIRASAWAPIRILSMSLGIKLYRTTGFPKPVGRHTAHGFGTNRLHPHRDMGKLRKPLHQYASRTRQTPCDQLQGQR